MSDVRLTDEGVVCSWRVAAIVAPVMRKALRDAQAAGELDDLQVQRMTRVVEEAEAIRDQVLETAHLILTLPPPR